MLLCVFQVRIINKIMRRKEAWKCEAYPLEIPRIEINISNLLK